MILADKKHITHAFNRAATRYDSTAVLAHEVGKRLIERLQFIRQQPKVILDLGSGTSHTTHLLEKYYRKADILAIDIAINMLKQAKPLMQAMTHQHFICADSEYLPLPDQSVDLVFSNLMMPWCENLEHLFLELRRVLKPEGVLLFSTLGPDTLQELRESWAKVDNLPHVHPCFDMHDIGDLLIHTRFAEPVMDAEHITLTYPDIFHLLKEFKAMGAQNLCADRQKSLMGKRHFEQWVIAYEAFRNAKGALPTTYEIIYGHAFVPSATLESAQNTTEVRVPISQLQRKRLF